MTTPPPTPIAARKVEVRRRGNGLGIWFFRQALRIFGLWGAYRLLDLVALYYALFDLETRARVSPYLVRRYPRATALGRWVALYRLFHSQGRQLIDTHASLLGAVRYDLVMERPEAILALGADPKGCVLLMSHMGNWKITMPAFDKVGKPICLVKRPDENRAMAESLGLDREDAKIRIISPEGDFGGAIEIVKALDAGAMVAMMGDRRYGFETIRVPDFLGAPAYFPFGAFHIAATCGVPVAVLLSAKTGPRQYTVALERLIRPVYRPGRPKREQLAEWAAEYAKTLEEFVLKYPDQCFIFNDVWREESSAG